MPWVPNLGEWYDRKARTVGACLLSEAEAGGSRSKNAGEVVLVAVDEDGETLGRLRCRWLLVSIRSREPRAHDVDSKIKELVRLEQWLRDVRCEAVAVGACNLQCRRIREELDHIAFAMALRSSADSAAERMADAYYRTPCPLSDTPMPHEFAAITRSVFEDKMPFRAVFVDETIPALWAQTAAAQAEAAELTPSLQIALACGRSLQVPRARARSYISCPPPV